MCLFEYFPENRSQCIFFRIKIFHQCNPSWKSFGIELENSPLVVISCVDNSRLVCFHCATAKKNFLQKRSFKQLADGMVATPRYIITIGTRNSCMNQHKLIGYSSVRSDTLIVPLFYTELIVRNRIAIHSLSVYYRFVHPEPTAIIAPKWLFITLWICFRSTCSECM